MRNIMQNRIGRIIVILMTLLALAGCGREAPPSARAPAPLSGHFLITGSSTMLPLVQAIAERFHNLHPAVFIEVQGGGSGRGIADALEGKADIGMASRVLNEKESGLASHAIARDGVAVIVHRSNPVQALSDEQVAAIFTGKLRDWREVGGMPGAIRVVSRLDGYSSLDLFTHYYKIDAAQIRATARLGDNAALIAEVLAHPQSIAFMSVGEAARRALAGEPIRLLPIGGVVASSQTIKSGDYPLARPLTLVTKVLPEGLAKAFIDFARSPQVNDLILAHDFVSYQD